MLIWISHLWMKITQWPICVYGRVFCTQMIWYVWKIWWSKKFKLKFLKSNTKTQKCARDAYFREWNMVSSLNLAIFCRISLILYLLGIFDPHRVVKIKKFLWFSQKFLWFSQIFIFSFSESFSIRDLKEKHRQDWVTQLGRHRWYSLCLWELLGKSIQFVSP